MINKKRIYIGLGVLVIIIAAAVFFNRGGGNFSIPLLNTMVINEELKMPDTKGVALHDGRAVAPGNYDVPINDSNVIASKAVLTLKDAHGKSLPLAQAWSPDAALISIKSLGAVTPEGKSGGWQILFGSRSLRAGYEIVIHGDEPASKKQVPSASYGYDIPLDWYDSPDALVSLRSQPQFAESTVSSVNLYYNEDGKRWGYVLATSNGTVSMPIR